MATSLAAVRVPRAQALAQVLARANCCNEIHYGKKDAMRPFSFYSRLLWMYHPLSRMATRAG